MGILKNDSGQLLPPLTLKATKYIPKLEGVTWNGVTTLPDESKLIIRRSKINSSIILRESDESAKYDLFQRLNTGGSQASDQEVRNCIMVMIRPEFFRWIRDLASNEDFVSACALSDRPIQESYDIELALRFFVFSFIKNEDLTKVGDVGVFLSDKMRNLVEADSDTLEELGHVFCETFRLLNNELGDSSFKRFNVEKVRFMGGFLISQYEVVACGIGHNIRAGVMPTDVIGKVPYLWTTTEYTSWTGSGITAARRLPRLIPLGRSLFSA
ncbi:MAG: hypothetical protein EOO61_18195 [Hymenobacter sp.]|nr:MAG: hypothetical protein EOO61_18195 [Hymenobacter sp.]